MEQLIVFFKFVASIYILGGGVKIQWESEFVSVFLSLIIATVNL